MERVEGESVRLFCPGLADKLVEREAFERVEPAGEIVSCDEVCELGPQLIVRLVEIYRFAVASLIVRFMPRPARLSKDPSVLSIDGRCHCRCTRIQKRAP